MFNKIASLSVVAFLASSVSTLVIPRATAPDGWQADLLEDYSVYNTRYLALGCQTQHNTEFFDKCCHPLLKDEKLESRPAECTPSSNASPSSAVHGAAASSDGEDLEDCEEEEDEPAAESTPATPSPSPAPAPAKKPETTTTPAKESATSTPAKVAVAVEASISGGFATFFYQNGVAGACGKVHQDSDFIAAMDYRRYGNTSVRSGLCGKRVEITNTKNKKKVTVQIADACPTCTNNNSIDLSVAAFKAIASLDEGLVPISWNFV